MQPEMDLAKSEFPSQNHIHAEVCELRARLLESREAERLLLAQELHDGPIQDLLALSYALQAEATHGNLSDHNSVRAELMEAIRKLRVLCEELRPSTLLSSGLEESIRSHLAGFAERHPSYEIQCEIAQDDGLSERTRLAFYRIYQQALANIIRHSQADQVFVYFHIRDGQAVLEIQDNGRGFMVPESWIEFARNGHLGLVGGFERAEAIGGKFIVDSAPGKGTKITVSVSLDAQNG